MPASPPASQEPDTMSQPTPETDSLSFRIGKNALHPDTVVVAVNDAQRLERERDEWKGKAQDRAAESFIYMRERDEARAALAKQIQSERDWLATALV